MSMSWGISRWKLLERELLLGKRTLYETTLCSLFSFKDSWYHGKVACWSYSVRCGCKGGTEEEGWLFEVGCWKSSSKRRYHYRLRDGNYRYTLLSFLTPGSVQKKSFITSLTVKALKEWFAGAGFTEHRTWFSLLRLHQYLFSRIKSRARKSRYSLKCSPSWKRIRCLPMSNRSLILWLKKFPFSQRIRIRSSSSVKVPSLFSDKFCCFWLAGKTIRLSTIESFKADELNVFNRQNKITRLGTYNTQITPYSDQ